MNTSPATAPADPVVAPAERVVDIAGHPVRYRVAGRGEPLVLVHGLSGSTAWWSRNLPALAARHRVYLVDLPGFGAMGRGGPRFVLAEAASWLATWMTAVEIEEVDLVGHSMGATISLRLAAQHPEAVRRLVLVAPAGLRTERSSLAQALPLAFALRHASPSFGVVLVRDALRAGPRTLLRAARDLMAGDVREDLGRIAVPTLLLFGEHDPLVPPVLGEVFRREIADARLVVFERTAHVPMFERPREFEETVLRFLDGPPAGAAPP